MKTTTLNKSQIEAAKILGIADFNNGVKCIPAVSKSCMGLIEVNQHIKGATVKIMKAWAKGWHTANLSKVTLN